MSANGTVMTVPRGAGYRFGNDVANMDPITVSQEEPPAYAPVSKPAQPITEKKRVTFEQDPPRHSRSRSRSRSRTRAPLNSQPTAAPEPSFNEMFSQPASNTPSFVDTRDGQTYVVFGSDGTRYKPGHIGQPSAHGLNADYFNTNISFSPTPAPIPEPAQRVSHGSTHHPANRHPAANGSAFDALLNLVQAPVAAVDRPEMKMLAVVIEGFIVLTLFNWVTAIVGGVLPTLLFLGLGFAAMQSMSTNPANRARPVSAANAQYPVFQDNSQRGIEYQRWWYA